jgi:monoamine oxidase
MKRSDFILNEAIRSLANALKIEAHALEQRIEASFVMDWQSDPFSLGAYSYVPVGGITAPILLAEPVSDTLFFAGEATNTEGNAGTMHGAIQTGYRAAEEVLSVAWRPQAA